MKVEPLRTTYRQSTPPNGYLLAVIAVSLFSISPPLVRFAPEIGAMEITCWRLLTGAVTIASASLLTGHTINWRSIITREFAAYGLLVAVHFGSYVGSLQFTTVAHSLAITYTAPVFVALLSRIFLAEVITSRTITGIAIAVVGVIYLTGFEPNVNPNALIGDGLALVTAITFGVYSIMGRRARDRFPLYDYTCGVYGWGAIWLLPVALWSLSGSTYTPVATLAVIASGVLPLGAGHTLYNAAVRVIPPTAANIIAMFEVVGGTVLTALIFGEVPTLTTTVGSGVILAGILVVVVHSSPSPAHNESG